MLSNANNLQNIRSSENGFILVDILVAIGLSAIFISVLSYGYSNTFKSYHKTLVMRNEIASTSIIEYTFPSIIKAESKRVCANEFFRDSDQYLNQISTDNISNSADYQINNVIPIVLPISSAQYITHFEVRNGYAYISFDSNVNSDKDFMIIDIRDRDNPSIVGSIDTGPGLSSFVIVGSKAYASAASTAFQLHIIDISNRYSPVLLSKFKIPPPYATATMPYATSIQHFSRSGADYVIFGTEKWVGNEFNIIDVSNPLMPNFVNSYKIDSKVNSIFLYTRSDLEGRPPQMIAYVAASSLDQLLRFDISNVNQPNLVDSFSPSGWNRQEGKSIDIRYDRLVFGRTAGGFDIVNDHELFAWPTSTIESGGPLSTFSHSQNISKGIYGIVEDIENIFTLSRSTMWPLMIWNNELEQITTSSLSEVFLQNGEVPKFMNCDNDHIYILSSNIPILYEITLHK